MINVNDISPQRITELENEVATLKKMIYDLDGKSIRSKTLSGDTITGGVIEGTLLKTANGNNYIHLHDQYMEFYHNGELRMTFGFADLGTNQPTIKLYGEPEISGTSPLGVMTTSGTSVELSGYWNFEDGLFVYGDNNLGASGGLSSGGSRIYLKPGSTSQFYIQRDTDGALSIHEDSGTYAKIAASAITWY